MPAARVPYRREPALSADSRARLCPNLPAERALSDFLARLTPDERRAFWLGVLILDRSVNVDDAAGWWRGQHPGPAVASRTGTHVHSCVHCPARWDEHLGSGAESKGCVVCGAVVPPTGRGGRPQATCGADACQRTHYGYVKYPIGG